MQRLFKKNAKKLIVSKLDFIINDIYSYDDRKDLCFLLTKDFKSFVCGYIMELQDLEEQGRNIYLLIYEYQSATMLL